MKSYFYKRWKILKSKDKKTASNLRKKWGRFKKKFIVSDCMVYPDPKFLILFKHQNLGSG
jgi:hypothetical protein